MRICKTLTLAIALTGGVALAGCRSEHQQNSNNVRYINAAPATTSLSDVRNKIANGVTTSARLIQQSYPKKTVAESCQIGLAQNLKYAQELILNAKLGERLSQGGAKRALGSCIHNLASSSNAVGSNLRIRG